MIADSVYKDLQRLANESNCKINTIGFAEYLDNQDEIKEARNEFSIPKNKNLPGVDLSVVGGDDSSLYFNGNSLGLCPVATESVMVNEIKKWLALGSHGRYVGEYPWEKLDDKCTEILSNLVGAKPIEVAHGNGLTINIHLMLVSFYDPTPSKHKIIIEHDAFTSDYMAIESQIRYHGYHPETSLVIIKPRKGEQCLRLSDILFTIETEGDQTCLVFLGGVNYYTGEKLDMESITRASHEKGCKVGFDLAHAVGNVGLQLHDWEVDFACWCSYKYLNAGHGSIGGIFLHEKYADDASLKKFKGWWSIPLSKRFEMENSSIEEIPGARSYVISNTSLFAIIPLLVSLQIFEKYGWAKILRKQRLLTGYLHYLLDHMFAHSELTVYTPSDPDRRGCQLSLAFEKPLEKIAELLSKRGITLDVRKPNVIRVAPVPLYNTFKDVYLFCKHLRHILDVH